MEVAGGGGAVIGRWRGDRWRKSLARGGLEGWPGGDGPTVRSVFGAGGAAWGCSLAGGGWRLRGVEVELELEALDFVSNAWKID